MITSSLSSSVIRPSLQTVRQAKPRFEGGWLFGPDGKGTKAKTSQKYIVPKPSYWVQRGIYGLEDTLLPLGWKSGLRLAVDIRVSPQDIEKLRSVPQNAGCLLVGPHPDVADAITLSKLFDLAGHMPQGLIMAGEIFNKFGPLRWILNRYGAIPIQRGGGTDNKVNDYIETFLSEGKWGGLLPEGAVTYSRTVTPMRYGCFKYAIHAALKAMEKGDDRPIFIQPFSHTYFYENPIKAEESMKQTLSKLEKRFFGEPQAGNLAERIYGLGHQIIESKAKKYHVTLPENRKTLAEKTQFLMEAITTELEKHYMGGVREGFIRDRASKVKAAIENQQKRYRDPLIRELMDLDMLQATEVKKLVSLLEAPEDLQAPLETLGDELRRYEDVLGLSSPPFDRRIVAVKIHDPIDMRPSALRYRELATIPDPGEREKQEKALLKKHANQLQALVQHGIDELVTAHQAFPQIGVHT